MKWLYFFSFSILIFCTFAFGYYFHRTGLQHELIYYANRVASLGWPASSLVPNSIRCACVLFPCPCGVGGKEPNYEVSLWGQFLAMDPPSKYRINVDFPRLLEESVGFNNILPTHDAGGADVTVLKETSYSSDRGALLDLRFHYRHPKLELRGLYAKHKVPSSDLIIVVHGTHSSEEAVMGLRGDDYSRSVGRSLFNLGYDVLAPSVTSDPLAAGAINWNLQLLGTQIYGLWSRLICDAGQYLRENHGYERIVLYGLSNGGTITKYATAQCDAFDLSIIDDVGIDDREGFWNNIRQIKSGKWIFAFGHRRPLLSESSGVDWLHFAQNDLVLIHRERYFRDTLFPKIEGVSELLPELNERGRVRFIYKKTELHEPELDLINGILDGAWSSLEGVTFKKPSQ